ncbi:hypothetical protein HY622_03855 [Candidatus Uhrbacteria bacterium]|nr:hypothetical protein [Candidatus Uhrbacteria bacterium]
MLQKNKKKITILGLGIFFFVGVAFFAWNRGVTQFFFQSDKAEKQFITTYSAHKDFATIYPLITEAREIVQKNPRHDGAYQSLAQSYFTIGAFDRARDALLKAVEIVPDNDAYWSFLGRTYQRLKAYPDAAAAYAHALELDRSRVEYYTQLAWLYYFRFEGDDMLKSYDILKQGLERFPDDKDLLFDITRYYLYENKMEEFAYYAPRYLVVDPTDQGGFKKELEKYKKSK